MHWNTFFENYLHLGKLANFSEPKSSVISLISNHEVDQVFTDYLCFARIYIRPPIQFYGRYVLLQTWTVSNTCWWCSQKVYSESGFEKNSSRPASKSRNETYGDDTQKENGKQRETKSARIANKSINAYDLKKLNKLQTF